MKGLMVVIVALSITGCGRNEMHAAKSEYACRDSGGVYAYGNFFLQARCNNGDSFNMQSIKQLPKGWRIGDEK